MATPMDRPVEYRPERPQPRPRSKSGFSFKSDKSHNSHNSGGKEPLRETAAEKRRSAFTQGTKANPNAAMNEEEPIAAALERPTIASLRSFRHSDSFGNPISDPDLSNPTRSRWERPLDTIRSFEAAIDSEYKRRSQFRQESVYDGQNNYQSRRNSFYGGDHNGNSRHPGMGGGYYGNRGGRESYTEGYGPSSGPRPRYNPRMQSDPMLNRYNGNGNGVYHTNGYQQSRDTVNTGGSNGSQSEPVGYSTDPSSENSSLDRPTPPQKYEQADNYGFNGFGGPPQYNGPILEEYRNHNDAAYGPPRNGGPPNASAHYRQNPLPPPPPQHGGYVNPAANGYVNSNGGYPPPGHPLAPSSGNAAPQQRQVIKLGNSTNNSEKRKSWFKRRFSRS